MKTKNLKCATIAGVVLMLSSAAVFAEAGHHEQALMHAENAAKAADAKAVVGHAEEAKTHAKTVIEHMNAGMTSLDEAIEHGNKGHTDMAKKAAEQAVMHFKAAQ